MIVVRRKKEYKTEIYSSSGFNQVTGRVGTGTGVPTFQLKIRRGERVEKVSTPVKSRKVKMAGQSTH